ncbi:hypothetical protein NFA_23760 [Nocardia farcinica IFM 10152]|uniref:Uncharacterized protein n=1 Tax=Nocardia farcinica (strain IFM 10152) TaxID=247156 RepID=Q5YX68_NOCFA|nr:hypothetical protein NFA_23760 [Nocardia farcinica IFM 10152]
MPAPGVPPLRLISAFTILVPVSPRLAVPMPRMSIKDPIVLSLRCWFQEPADAGLGGRIAEPAGTQPAKPVMPSSEPRNTSHNPSPATAEPRAGIKAPSRSLSEPIANLLRPWYAPDFTAIEGWAVAHSVHAISCDRGNISSDQLADKACFTFSRIHGM